MSCPSDEALLSALLGEASVNDARAVESHGVGCAACRARLQQAQTLLSDLAAPPAASQSDDDFVRGVLAACAEAAPPKAKRPVRALAWSGSLVAAAAAAWLAFAPAREPTPEFQARGVANEASAPAFADVLFVRERVFRPLASAHLHPGDALAVRYTNRSDDARYLAVFAVDARGDVHWIYPAYLDAASDPGSVSLAPHAQGRMLDEVVELEEPAAGALRVFALLTEQPVHVREIEALPVLDAHALSSKFEGANVQTWRTTWARD